MTMRNKIVGSVKKGQFKRKLEEMGYTLIHAASETSRMLNSPKFLIFSKDNCPPVIVYEETSASLQIAFFDGYPNEDISREFYKLASDTLAKKDIGDIDDQCTRFG